MQAFDKYKQIPQYQALFPDMDLGRFQTIFLWEWTHRLIGRLLGVALLIPLIVFWARGMLSRRLKWQMLGIFALGGLQGFVGWWMVTSGLSGRVEVAQQAARHPPSPRLDHPDGLGLVGVGAASHLCRGACTRCSASPGDPDDRRRVGADRARAASSRACGPVRPTTPGR